MAHDHIAARRDLAGQRASAARFAEEGVVEIDDGVTGEQAHRASRAEAGSGW